MPLAELREATEEGRLALLPVERVIGGGDGRYTLAQVAARSGLDAGFLVRLWRALGVVLPEEDEPALSDADLDAATRVNAFREAGLSEDDILEISRVMSRAMARVAATIGEVFTETYLRAGDNERDLALRYARMSRRLLPMLGPVLEHNLGIQQVALIRQAAVDTSSLASGRLPGAEEVCVCFADLVGFTKLGESVEATELGRVVERLEELAEETAARDVRLIKTIGDEVMLASQDVDALLGSALRLVGPPTRRARGIPGSGRVWRSGRRSGEPVTGMGARSTWRAGSPAWRAPEACWSTAW